jgi:hypothetical protein
LAAWTNGNQDTIGENGAPVRPEAALMDRKRLMNDAQEREAVSARFYAAVNQLQQGDPASMFALWSHRGDVLNLGPQGGRQQGWAAVQQYFAQAARLAAANPGAVHGSGRDFVTVIVGEMAYVTATEEVQVSSLGQIQQFIARSTNIYRREGNDWKLIYRHADGAPVARTPSHEP